MCRCRCNEEQFKVLHLFQQENRAVARKPRDAAAVLFSLKFTDDIDKFNQFVMYIFSLFYPFHAMDVPFLGDLCSFLSFLADRTIGRAFATACRLSVCLSVCL